jgi:hypothetical protein
MHVLAMLVSQSVRAEATLGPPSGRRPSHHVAGRWAGGGPTPAAAASAGKAEPVKDTPTPAHRADRRQQQNNNYPNEV